MLILEDVTKRFCDVITLTSAFYDSVSKNKPMHKFKLFMPSSQNDVMFRRFGRDVTMMTLTAQN